MQLTLGLAYLIGETGGPAASLLKRQTPLDHIPLFY